MKQEQLQSIIKLLDDPDESIFLALEKELLSQGTQVVKPLEDAWEHSHDQLVHRRIEHITHQIQLSNSISDFSEWVHSGAYNLTEASYIISRYQYPELDRTDFMAQICQITSDLEAELVPGLTPLEQIRVVNHILFHVHHFDRAENTEKTYQTFYMNNVFSQKKGNLFTLCMLYAAIAQSAKLPVQILSLPENLAVAYLDKHSETGKLASRANLFYVNPFSKGAVFGNNEIRDFLTRAKYPLRDEYFTPISNRHFVILFLETLHLYYHQELKDDKCKDLETLIDLVKNAEHQPKTHP